MNKMIFNKILPIIRVFETKLLDKARFDRMVEAPSASLAYKVLLETEYAGDMNNAKRAEDYEIVLGRELRRFYQEIRELSPVREVADIMSIRYDYHNLKVLVKAKVLDKDFSHMLFDIGAVSTEELNDVVMGGEVEGLSPIMEKSIKEVLETFENNKDPQEVDIIFDKYMFEEMIEISKKIDDSFLKKYINAQIDLTNIKTLIRVKRQDKDREFSRKVMVEGGLVTIDRLMEALEDTIENLAEKLANYPYGEMVKLGIEDYLENGSLNLLDKLSDDYIMTMMKEAKLIGLGLEPVLAYIYAKETEIKLIRIIMVGKLNNISAEVIRERLRDAYV